LSFSFQIVYSFERLDKIQYIITVGSHREAKQ